MEKHLCKVCGRSFPSSRSLGGHMRSHSIPKSEEKPMRRYVLRENQKNSWRLEEKEKNSKCHFEMRGDDLNMKYEEFEKKEEDLHNSRSYEEGEDQMQSQFKSEVTPTVFSARERLKRRRSPDSLQECENEQEVGAFCLLMLSRGVGSVTHSSDDASMVMEQMVEEKRSNSSLPKLDFGMNEPKKGQSFPKHDFEMNELKKVRSFTSQSEFSNEMNRSNASSCSADKKDINSVVLRLEKRGRYQCTTCDMSFHSYQALGGHRASHKKIKVSDCSEIRATDQELNIQNHRSKSTKNRHECSICGKIFASGQALGGHKRSHLVPANNAASADAVQASSVVNEKEQKTSMIGSIDLNLPAVDDEIYDNPNGNMES